MGKKLKLKNNLNKKLKDSVRTNKLLCTPILAPARPLVVLNDNFIRPESPIVMEGTNINGFTLHFCTIEIKSFRILDTPCGGDLCDQ